MTKVTIHKNKAGDYLGFVCEGHADYAKRGEDIVCAAISVLVINTINSLEELTKEPMQVETDKAAGKICCTFKNHPLRETSLVLMESLMLGLQNIQTQYGSKHCKLTVEEV
ncbi:MAG: ribosomal-processing cysteine protease Prp [Bacteroidales bacterium]|nr:ribosomal-processing cysteine protease Prp [Clostridium sp.]MCM1266456.1 ribosomal-processing cysteine protease Prp [Bacteroidales bacterium]MCM1414470.1 ribosomal-processing cysteine protease Prp [bacterium]MCM1422357.1 ribosomal-processing cysteine protease Prp [bacterium]